MENPLHTLETRILPFSYENHGKNQETKSAMSLELAKDKNLTFLQYIFYSSILIYFVWTNGAYKPSQISKIGLFEKIVNYVKAITVCAKNVTLDV